MPALWRKAADSLPTNEICAHRRISTDDGRPACRSLDVRLARGSGQQKTPRLPLGDGTEATAYRNEGQCSMVIFIWLMNIAFWTVSRG